jgi:hypothetical protein
MVTSTDLSEHSRPTLRLVPNTSAPTSARGEVCVLLDPDRALVWLHGVIDADLADDLVEAAADLVEAGLPVTIRGSAITSCDGTALQLVGRLVAAGLPVRIIDPAGHLRRALRRAIRPGCE